MKTIQGYTYRVNEHIGKGYSSTVHKGVNDKTGEEVSIKVIEMAKLSDPINQKLLQLQVSALRCLANTAHVLHLYDVYATKNNTYLITELCESDLSSILKRKNTFSYPQAIEVLRQLVKGYHDIHLAGFLHRDIKPANIFYRNGMYKYGDFGFAIPVNEIQEHKNYNVGSPVYMPPETLKHNIYSVSCDIWAIGIVFYQMLKGLTPWRACTQKDLYEKLTNQPLDVLTVSLPQPARKFLARVLNLDVNQRPTVQELLTWPNKLQSIGSQIRHLSPSYQRGRNLNFPLQELGSNTAHLNRMNFISNHSNTGVLALGVENKAHPQMFSSKTQETNRQSTIQQTKEDADYKQAYFFANNSINYVKFLHRVLKFTLPPLALDLTQISQSINKLMFQELQILKQLFEGEGKSPNIPQWSDFLKSAKSQIIRKKIKKYEAKYTMFHESGSQFEDIQGPKVFQAVNTLVSYLDIQGYNAKMVVAADYLTTLYQLLHLRQKYESHQFMKLSKIDLIMQGNPYNTSAEHLQKLKKKLLLIKP